MNNRKAILFSAPSGSGKTTIIRQILTRFDCFEFSISATSRQPREGEKDGVDYYFLTPEEFERRVAAGQFLEWEEVYAGVRYGTLKSEIDRIWDNGHVIIFDVDVKGGVNLKKYFGDQALSILIKAPSVDVLRDRLVKRGTDSMEAIDERVAKAESELAFAEGKFDYDLVNDVLEQTFAEAERVVDEFLARP